MHFLKPNSEFEYTSVLAGSLNYSQIKGNQFVVLTNLHSISSGLAAGISTFLADGGSVAIFPADKCDAESYNKFFSSVGAAAITAESDAEQEMARINLQQNIFKDVF